MLQPVTSALTVVADHANKYADLGLRTIADRVPDAGPLGGLEAALADGSGVSWLLLCSCDLLIIQPSWVEQLLNNCASHVDGVAFRSDRWQPMPALYAQSCRPVVDEHLRSNEHSMQRLLDRLAVTALAVPADWPDPWQINSHADLDRYRASLVERRGR
jgi:molybdopterin-guanine dinucleotide biosynthesis protein A